MTIKLAKGGNLTVAGIRKMAAQLNGKNQMPYATYTCGDLHASDPLKAGELSPLVHLDTNGVVCFPGGMMHPETFRFIVGEQAYQELLKRPRVRSEYTEEELHD